jgi:hypothetical protein
MNNFTLSEMMLAIKNWDVARLSPTIPIAMFSTNVGFEVEYPMVEAWQLTNPDRIHVYPAIYNCELYFVLVDDVTDSKRITGTQNIFMVKGLDTCSLNDVISIIGANDGTNLTVEDAYRRSLMWFMCKTAYFSSFDYRNKELFCAFSIPFRDFWNNDILKTYRKDIATFAFNYKKYIYPEIILWNSTQNNTKAQQGENELLTGEVADVSLPVPPFGNEQNYQLYQISQII